MTLKDLPSAIDDIYEGTFPIFARVNDAWRYEGVAHSRTRVRAIGIKVEEENGPGSFRWFQIDD